MPLKSEIIWEQNAFTYWFADSKAKCFPTPPRAARQIWGFMRLAHILFILSDVGFVVKFWIVLPFQASKNYSNDTIWDGGITLYLSM